MLTAAAAAAASVAVSFSVMREMSLLSELLRRSGRGVSGPPLALPFKNSCLVDCARIVKSVALVSSLSLTMKDFVDQLLALDPLLSTN